MPLTPPWKWTPSLLPPLFLSSSLAAPARAQEPPPDAEPDQAVEELEAAQPEVLPETVVTANRQPTAAFDTPYSIETVDQQKIQRRSYRTTPQALRDVPGVMVQETAVGQGSPYIRGFTGFHNLYLIDGIRLNNSVFRAGPNQYLNTVDPLSVQRFEVLKGPSSVLYGSDAIGGTINTITKVPYGYGAGTNVGGLVSYRYADAEDSNVGRAEVSATSDEAWGMLLGGSLKDFGDVTGGSEVGLMPNTGYGEHAVDLKVERRFTDETRFVFAHQRVRQDDVPRTHQTVDSISWEGTTVGSDLRRDLDQSRDLTYAQLIGDPGTGLFENYVLSLSWQVQEESRDRIRSNGNQEFQGFEVGTLGVFAHASTATSIGTLTYGAEYYRDAVDSFSSTNPVQGPVADDATYDLLGLFLQDEIEVTERLALVLGGRFNYAAARSDDVSDPVTGNPISIDEDWSAFVGSLRLLYRLTPETWNLFGGVSQGFRAPNLSDLTRFDTARTGEFEIPAPGLDSEEYLTFELGTKVGHRTVTAEGAVFYTDVNDQIVRYPTGNVNGAGEAEVTKSNVGDGYVYGFDLGAAWLFVPEWTLFGNLAWVEGKVDTYPTSAPVIEREYIDRLMPLMGQLGVRWDDGTTWAELMTVYADEADRLSTRDKGDTSRIPPGGTPGYTVLHARAGRRIGEHLDLMLGVGNLLDEDYRIHGSGQNMPGRNLILSLAASF